ncbi:MAG: hypothetical protein DME25_16605 [Verrucomicrobia bacterium]|nr:MAG: hypothetical protein DME25_16605 [Verrucomicrobiota bacterium]
MFNLKPLSKDAIPAALEKAMRYRLLNEPQEAESICLDILRADPEHQQALVILVLALTDRFGTGVAVGDAQAQEIVARLRDPYERAYYSGIICERRAKAYLHQHAGGASFNAYEKLNEAMGWYEKAEALRPPGHDDALLRWNTCARIIMQNKLAPRTEEAYEPSLE